MHVLTFSQNISVALKFSNSVRFPYLRFPFKGYVFEILHHPLEWMPSEDIHILQRKLQRIAQARLGYIPDFSFFSDVAYFKNKTVIICSDRKNKRDYCFGVMFFLGEYNAHPVMHLGPLISVNESRGLSKMIFVFGIMYSFFNERIRTKFYLTTLTHVPRLFGIYIDYFKNVYPNLNPNARPRKIHIDLKERLFDTYLREWHLKKLPIVDERFVVKGFRKQMGGSILYDDTPETVPKHRNSAYNDRLLEMLDYANGDEVLQICEVSLFKFFRPVNSLVFFKTK